MNLQAKGTFEVRLVPLAVHEAAQDAGLGRMSIDKVFSGDLSGASHGEMLSGGDPRSGSAGYVAMERVSGTLQGREGTFMLQHSGTMDGGGHSLRVSVVPGTGTGALQGLAGELTIDITGGKHFYTFAYHLPDAV